MRNDAVHNLKLRMEQGQPAACLETNLPVIFVIRRTMAYN